MSSRYVVPAIGAALVFVSATAVMVAVMPGPFGSVDYFIFGTVATLMACLAFFLGVVRLSRLRDVFYKTRRKAKPP